jgi:hypothetical protein
MDEERQYFYEGEWKTYSELYYEHGVTRNPSTPITIYDDDLNEYSAWIDTENGNIWVESYEAPFEYPNAQGRWFTPSELPFWIKTGDLYSVYLISQPIALTEYTKNSVVGYEYNGQIQSYLYLHNTFGLTTTPSSIYFTRNNIIKCWYNADDPTDKYWDVDTTHWYLTAPDYSDYSGGMDSLGASGLFLYIGEPAHYGTLISGDDLRPASINFSNAGELSCTRIPAISLTGTWSLLTEVLYSSHERPCIVFATKISSNTIARTSPSPAPQSSVEQTRGLSLGDIERSNSSQQENSTANNSCLAAVECLYF